MTGREPDGSLSRLQKAGLRRRQAPIFHIIQFTVQLPSQLETSNILVLASSSVFNPSNMVSLRSLVTGAVALMAATVNAALTPQQIADGINRITEKSRALQEPAQSITIVNAPLIVIGQGPFPVRLAYVAVQTPSSLANRS